MKDFDKFMSQLQETNQTLDFFCDFEKISQNVDNIKLSLCMLNSLIGSTDMRKSVETIWKRDPSAFNVMDILIAVRSEGKKKVLDNLDRCIVLDSLFTSVDGVMEFLDSTGLTEVFQSKKINNLVDYVFGIETGLDSNARKNRSGHIMENMIARIFDNLNFQLICSDNLLRLVFLWPSSFSTYLFRLVSRFTPGWDVKPKSLRNLYLLPDKRCYLGGMPLSLDTSYVPHLVKHVQ